MLNEILGTRSNQEIGQIKAAFKNGTFLLMCYLSFNVEWKCFTRHDYKAFIIMHVVIPAYGEELEHDIKGDTTGNFETALIALTKVQMNIFCKYVKMKAIS